uniref:STI1 domain-containing protein n=1 Tax=Trieres chinensis TaxID=1514140 RepID=A0A7S2EJ90_TRICV|mmetsp:Transcript_26195/g.53665  ORF Transcript_26195/g.53665 Transcript_26195/m.53665 type:complete len:203 (+) Transcript_26195:134-742(+)|eukprot:CAMPEP_0183293592 /NCGR_PEP_ID=MMETSP0160_2-20130417/2212_1 /TAXON_ID=2839 ORGANISM="Odontella Sinensis, Strain Grunow 1884" /NCGR_SAMPLE_ID=MMETSP0160_2 /ASSEMBLY_ACC=CAM_ASM_000250 /LENGTH=202 /DNA_ID=CAMNT_0025454735 /DNA_START=104 /DNA_END=712 /DNA_ORIENTATION=-
MKVFKTALSAGLLFLSNSAFAERGDDMDADALYDVNLGMAGLKHASKDPALLAQLFQDMQDPEMMAEAKKMMESPEFKAQMKKMEKSKEFKDAVKKTGDMMKDPATAARMEAQMEHMLKRGQDSLKKNAASSMAEAMDAMADPEVMAEATKMMKDPDFQKNMAKMAQDPAFKNYIQAMQEMMQDPETKAKVEAMAGAFKTAM